jgi:putative addiction module component (TIGR02574 family)
MSSHRIIETFRKLSQNEKISLVQQLWDEIAGKSDSLPITEVQRSLLDERLQQHEQNPTDVETWEKVKKDVIDEL